MTFSLHCAGLRMVMKSFAMCVCPWSLWNFYGFYLSRAQAQIKDFSFLFLMVSSFKVNPASYLGFPYVDSHMSWPQPFWHTGPSLCNLHEDHPKPVITVRGSSVCVHHPHRHFKFIFCPRFSLGSATYSFLLMTRKVPYQELQKAEHGQY